MPTSSGSEIGSTRDRLRVMIWKSANLILSVTVRPRTPVLSQYRQTLSTPRRMKAHEFKGMFDF
jgi:hypothetical protein